ncbi:MAG: MFS transporter [Pseudomonadota bacterium]
MKSLPLLIPLLVAVAILLCGNGVLLTLIALKANDAGWSTSIVGALGTVYFLGFLVSSVYTPRLIEVLGHARVFAALASLSAISAIMLVMVEDIPVWLISRGLAGFCIAGLFTVIESWINGAVDNADRGRMLSVYSLTDLGAVTASQLLLPVVGTEGTMLFLITAMLFCLSMLPVTLSPQDAPRAHEPVKIKLRDVWKISPLAFATCFVIGLTNSSYRAVGPIFATNVGLDTAGIAFFMTAGIIGGAVLQLPLGWASDRIDRRKVLAFSTICAVAAGVILALLSQGEEIHAPGTSVYLTGLEPEWFYVGSFLFGAFAMPLYSIAAAHANDFARSGQFATISAGMLFTYGVSATFGPLISAGAMDWFGPPGFFGFICLAHASLLLFAISRMRARDTVPDDERVRYTPLLRTSRGFFKLAKRRLTETQGDLEAAEAEAVRSETASGRTPGT